MQGVSRYCPRCGRNVFAIYQETQPGEHLLHGCLSVATCGLWLPVYLFLCIRKVYRCKECGLKV